MVFYLIMKIVKQIQVHPLVQVNLKNNLLFFQGPLGSLQINLALFDPKSQLSLQLVELPNPIISLYGTKKQLTSLCSLLEMYMEGVTQGYMMQLEAVGVGYKMSIENDSIHFRVGLSHSISVRIPSDIKVFLPKPVTLVIFGIDKQRVSQIVAQLRAIKVPEPYKGKGLRHKSEYVFRKEGKKK